MKSFKKNPPEWDEKELFKEMSIFRELYKERPIKNNIDGMRFQHMFATYFILKKKIQVL